MLFLDPVRNAAHTKRLFLRYPVCPQSRQSKIADAISCLWSGLALVLSLAAPEVTTVTILQRLRLSLAALYGTVMLSLVLSGTVQMNIEMDTVQYSKILGDWISDHYHFYCQIAVSITGCSELSRQQQATAGNSRQLYTHCELLTHMVVSLLLYQALPPSCS